MDLSTPTVPISVGELFDKFSILEIKKEKIKDQQKLKHVNNEIFLLKKLTSKYNLDPKLYDKLKKVNLSLWEVEDKLRIKEKNKEFDNIFIDLARCVYFTNDRRAEIKKEINKKMGSFIFEIKDYCKYK